MLDERETIPGTTSKAPYVPGMRDGVQEHIYKVPEDEKEVLSRIDCKPGDTVKVELPSIASTGYNWELDKLPEGVHCLFQEFRPTEASDPEIAGAGGTDIWTFKVRCLKVWSTIDFGLRQPWDEDASPARTCTLILMPDPQWPTEPTEGP